ncbi:MAG: hypothetical protein GXO74_00565, partial [Calditrichaeota bacterium]|nr:hypothetical protein [Calditrichota bacterium]
LSSAEALKIFFIQGKRSIVVSGTHGKTTTSSLSAWLLEAAGKDPSFMIGGIPKNFNQGYKLGASDLFVVEGDEYDTAFFDKAAKFFHYLPHTLIVNNIEFDHGDIYDDLDQIKQAFRRLVNLVPRNGLFLANEEDENVRELIPRSFAPVQTFGLTETAFWRADNIDFQPEKTKFDIIRDGKFFARVASPLFGYHNIRNVLAAGGAANFYGVSAEAIENSLPQFQNIVKRLDVKAVVNNITIYDDFAHHPSKVKSTINGLRTRFPAARIWAIFEPRTATSKMKIMEDKYGEAFDDADVVIVAPLHLPQKVQAEKRMSVESLVEKIKKRRREVHHLTPDEIVKFVSENAKPGDQILVMSNGSFENVPQRIADALRAGK